MTTAEFVDSAAACGFAASTLKRRHAAREMWAETAVGSLVPGAKLMGTDLRWHPNAFWLPPSEAARRTSSLSAHDESEVLSMLERMEKPRQRPESQNAA